MSSSMDAGVAAKLAQMFGGSHESGKGEKSPIFNRFNGSVDGSSSEEEEDWEMEEEESSDQETPGAPRQSGSQSQESSRDYELEAEIMFAYNLPKVPRRPEGIPKKIKVREPLTCEYFEEELKEIDENDFLQAFRRNQEAFLEEREQWKVVMRDLATTERQRRNLHVLYVKERQASRLAKKEQKRRQARRAGWWSTD